MNDLNFKKIKRLSLFILFLQILVFFIIIYSYEFSLITIFGIALGEEFILASENLFIFSYFY